LLAARAIAGTAAVPLALALALLLALALAIAACLPILIATLAALVTALAILAVLVTVLAILAILAGLVVRCSRQLLDRAGEVVERLGRARPALLEAIRTVAQLIRERLVARADLVGGLAQPAGQLAARGVGQLAGLVGQRAQLAPGACQVATVERIGGRARHALVAQRVGQRLRDLRVGDPAGLAGRIAGARRVARARLGVLRLARQLLGRVLRLGQRRDGSGIGSQVGHADAGHDHQPS